MHGTCIRKINVHVLYTCNYDFGLFCCGKLIFLFLQGCSAALVSCRCTCVASCTASCLLGRARAGGCVWSSPRCWWQPWWASHACRTTDTTVKVCRIMEYSTVTYWSLFYCYSSPGRMVSGGKPLTIQCSSWFRLSMPVTPYWKVQWS